MRARTLKDVSLAAVVASISAGIAADRDRTRRCHVCGCTWHNACPGSCWWIGADLCSSCGPNAARHLRERPKLRRVRDFHWTRYVNDQGFVVWRLIYVRNGRVYGHEFTRHKIDIQKFGRAEVARELHRARFSMRIYLLDITRNAEVPAPANNR
jgi:hypothetical protein